jgi:hypothetical protein
MTRTKRLALEWYEGLISGSEKDDRTQLVMGAKPTLDILARLMKRKLEALENKTDFNTPAWQFELAKSLGQKEALKDLLKLLTPVIEEN